MTTLIENAVPLADVARVTKMTTAQLEQEMRVLGLFLGRDWAGRPAVEVRDAAALVDGSARSEHDRAAAWHDHQVATEQWERDRAALIASAHQEAMYAAMRQGKSEAAANDGARVAGREAVERFEREHPAPTFEQAGASTTNWFHKIKEAVR